MTIFWILFWWTAASLPAGILLGKLLKRAAEQQTRPIE